MDREKIKIVRRLIFSAAPLSLLLVSAPAEARRLVSLMPSYTEIIFGLGAGSELVGVSNFCDWPPAAAKIERTGDYLRPDIEKIYSLKPDVVFSGSWAAGASAGKLSSLGIKVVSLPEEKNVAEIFSSIRLIAAELGRRDPGERLVRSLSAAIPPALPGPRVKVYIEEDSGGWTTGGGSFLSDAVRLAGGENIFAGEKKGYFQASWERVLLARPEAVILLAGSRNEFLSRPMAARLPASENGLIITSLDRDAFTRPGPRLFREIKKLRDILHGQK